MDVEPKEQERLYKLYWSIIEKNCKVDGSSYVSAFVRDYLTIANGEIPNKDAVFVTFKAKYPIMSGKPIEEVLETLRNSGYLKEMGNDGRTCHQVQMMFNYTIKWN